MKTKRMVRDAYVGLLREGLLRSSINGEIKTLTVSSGHVADAPLLTRILSYYWAKLHKFPNLRNPIGLNDRIQWCKVFDQSEQAAVVCDKLAFKSWVSDRIGGRYNAETLFFTDDLADFKRRLNRVKGSIFVKGNADSGSTRLVNPNYWRPFLMKLWFEECISYKYGEISGEWGYQSAQQGVLAEAPLAGAWATDYKFICVDGEPRVCHVIFGRPDNIHQTIIDMEQINTGISIYAAYRQASSFEKISLKVWDEMVAVSKALSANFRLCRVDLYVVEGCVYVGEVTLWPQSGTYRGSGQLKLEQFIAFDC